MSLKAELGKRLLTDMIRAAKGSDPAIVLVVDEHTSKVLSSALRMFDIMEAGVLVLQNLMKTREKLPDMPAIYFIDPTNECINRLIADFPEGGVSGAAVAKAVKGKTPICNYLNAHVFFTTHVPASGMNLLKGAPSLMKKIKSFVELNVDFLAFESRIFLFDQPHTIRDLYFPTDAQRLSQTLSAISKPLVSLCVTCQELPYVRYSSIGKSGICKGLASFFDIDMKKTISQLANWKLNENRERGTLLIVDRSMDPIAPLMHEFTFQAMVNDLLQVDGEIAHMPVDSKGLNESGLPKTKTDLETEEAAAELVLAEDDNLWIDFRHKHIGLVMQNVTAKFREFKGVNKMAVLQQDDKASVKGMIQAMKDMPEYKNMMKKYHKHMSLAGECMSRFDTSKLDELGDLEQDMATGLNAEGKSISIKEVKDKLVSLCQDPKISVLDKLRLVMIYIIGQGGIGDGTRRELMKAVDMDLQGAIRNLDNLGVDLSNSEKKTKKLSKERTEELKQRAKENELNLMRYLPAMHSTIEQLVTGQLKEESFPYTSPPPPGSGPAAAAASSSSARKGVSARKKAGGADWKNGGDAASSSSSSAAAAPSLDEDVRPRFIVFVLGGMTFSEMRSCYEIADKHNVNLLMGSTATLTPTEYIEDLSALSPEAFKIAIENSVQHVAYGGGAGAGAGRPAAAASSSAAAPAGRRSQHDEDSDDEAPVNLHKLNVKVGK